MQRNDGYRNDEVLVLFNVDQNRVIFSKFGCLDEIVLNPMETIEFDTATELFLSDRYVIIHNHPDNSRISINDIIVFLDAYDVYACIAIVNNGNIYYAIKEAYYKNKGVYQKFSMQLAYRIDSRSGKSNMSTHELLELEDKIYKNSSKFQLKFGRSLRRRT